MSAGAPTNAPKGWRDLLRLKSSAQPADLDSLADKCEQLPPERQAWGLSQVLHLLHADTLESQRRSANVSTETMWVSLLADSGAYDSAALALLPPECTYSCARLGDGTHSAQVVLPGGVGAYSRGALTLSLAISAALLRALARGMVEQRHTT